MLEEFKKFALKGNVLDMAVGVIIGGAFGNIVTSLVNDIIMPLIGTITGGINISAARFVLRDAEGDIPALTLNYGQFLQNIIDFLIIAISIFAFIKLISKFKKVEEPVSPEEPEPTNEEILLTEIKDILKDMK